MKEMEQNKIEEIKQRFTDLVSLIPQLHAQVGGAFIRETLISAGLNYSSYMEHDILERSIFGAFEIIKTPSRIHFRTFTGYEVCIAPSMDDEGETPSSLYSWLDGMLTLSREARSMSSEVADLNRIFGFWGMELADGVVDNPQNLTYGDILERFTQITEACLLKPALVFTDWDDAIGEWQQSVKRMEDWAKRLMTTMDAPAPAESAASERYPETYEHKISEASAASLELDKTEL